MSKNTDRSETLHCVITTIQGPTECMQILSKKWPGKDRSITIVGDSKGPFSYELNKTSLFDIKAQRASDWELAKILPEKHYARKNLGYLNVMAAGAKTIYETDDDNAPNKSWNVRSAECSSARISGSGWCNIYKEFSEKNIWPRGLPLNEILRTTKTIREAESYAFSPLQQGLANGSPDVDAVWRLILDEAIQFNPGPSIRLGKGLWCPFNSQSTWWWEEAYALMYLPSYCPFRMTDIWRSFVAQRCLWELDYELVFHGAEVFQERNPHNPMHDFADEVSGYLRNDEIRQTLESIKLVSGKGYAASNLKKCYEALVAINLIPRRELDLIDAWIADLRRLGIQ